MSAIIHAMHPAEPLDRTAVADGIDEARRLVDVAGMAAMDFPDDDGRDAMRTLLDLISDKLRALSQTVLPGGGS